MPPLLLLVPSPLQTRWLSREEEEKPYHCQRLPEVLCMRHELSFSVGTTGHSILHQGCEPSEGRTDRGREGGGYRGAQSSEAQPMGQRLFGFARHLPSREREEEALCTTATPLQLSIIHPSIYCPLLHYYRAAWTAVKLLMMEPLRWLRSLCVA